MEAGVGEWRHRKVRHAELRYTPQWQRGSEGLNERNVRRSGTRARMWNMSVCGRGYRGSKGFWIGTGGAVGPCVLGGLLRVHKKRAEFFNRVVTFIVVVPDNVLNGFTCGAICVSVRNGTEEGIVVAGEVLLHAAGEKRISNFGGGDKSGISRCCGRAG